MVLNPAIMLTIVMALYQAAEKRWENSNHVVDGCVGVSEINTHTQNNSGKHDPYNAIRFGHAY